jgi:CelD/BcsL family acetyltransferase involved in cellulose biosynthesis
MQSLLRVHVASSLSELTALEPAWSQLEAQAVTGEWFAGPRYLLPLLQTYFAEHTLAICCVYDGEELVGLLPLVHEIHRDAIGCRPTVGFPMHAHVRRIGLLASKYPLDVMIAVIRHLRNAGHSCLTLQNIEHSSEFDRITREAGTALGWQWFDMAGSQSAVARWPDGWQAYLRSRDSKLLRNLRSRQRKLDQAGFAVEVVRTPDEFDEAWPVVLDVETRCWKHPRQTSIANEPGTADLYENVGRQLALDGALRLYVLRQNGVAVAHAFGAVRNRSFFLLKNSFDEAFKSWSPGVLLVWQSIQDAADESCVAYDFLGDAAEWKREFCTVEPAYLSRRLFTASALRCQTCRLREETLKPIARRLGLKSVLSRFGVTVR